MVLGVSIDRLTPEMLQQFVHQHDLRYPIVLDAQYEAAQMYSVRGTPTSYLINRNGKVIAGAAGPKDWASAAAKRVIRHLLGNSS